MMICLESSLSVKESLTKIQNQMNDDLKAMNFSKGPIVGKIKGDRLILQKRNFNYKNPFAKFFYASISDKQGKTLLEGDFKLHRATKGALVFYFSFLLIVTGALALGMLTPLIELKVALIGFGMVLFMCAFFLIIYKFASKASQKEEAFLIEWLQTLLEG